MGVAESKGEGYPGLGMRDRRPDRMLRVARGLCRLPTCRPDTNARFLTSAQQGPRARAKPPPSSPLRRSCTASASTRR